ncbi:MAG: cytosine permease, partial [Clostridiales bacterium]|nr:cytosine permease [Clostridiales bacterium]
MAKKEFVNPNNSVGHIEKNDIRPIPLNEREGSPKSLTPMWIGSNTNYVVFLNGVLVVSLGLSFVESIFAVIIGNLLGCAVLGMASIMGPRTGTSGIATSRAPFGAAGAYIPIVVSTISVLGWFSINSIVATEGLME